MGRYFGNAFLINHYNKSYWNEIGILEYICFYNYVF